VVFAMSHGRSLRCLRCQILRTVHAEILLSVQYLRITCRAFALALIVAEPLDFCAGTCVVRNAGKGAARSSNHNRVAASINIFMVRLRCEYCLVGMQLLRDVPFLPLLDPHRTNQSMLSQTSPEDRTAAPVSS
jgi:hypothetical protein